MWLSLLTTALCVVAMFLISWPVALATIVIVLAFYLAVHYRKPGAFHFVKEVINIIYAHFFSTESTVSFHSAKSLITPQLPNSTILIFPVSSRLNITCSSIRQKEVEKEHITQVLTNFKN